MHTVIMFFLMWYGLGLLFGAYGTSRIRYIRPWVFVSTLAIISLFGPFSALIALVLKEISHSE